MCIPAPTVSTRYILSQVVVEQAQAVPFNCVGVDDVDSFGRDRFCEAGQMRVSRESQHKFASVESESEAFEAMEPVGVSCVHDRVEIASGQVVVWLSEDEASAVRPRPMSHGHERFDIGKSLVPHVSARPAPAFGNVP